MHSDKSYAHCEVTVMEVIVGKLLGSVAGIKPDKPAPRQRIAGIIKGLFPRLMG